MERTFGDFFANYMDIGRISPSILESKIHQLQIEAEERRLTLGLSFAGLVDDAALIQAESEFL